MRYLIWFSFLLLVLAALPACKEDAASEGQKSPAAASPNPWKSNGCELVTDEEVEQIFGMRRNEDMLNTQSLPDKCFCLRIWNKPDWREREANNEKPGMPYREPRTTLVVQAFDYGMEETAQSQFEMLARDRRDTYDADVQGIGDAALWSSSTATLVVRRRQLILNITLEYADEPQENLPKAREVAAVALKKI
ncbi:MAG: hypothetical protein ACR2K1_06195 [Saprospiraceae bacterium]